MLGAVETGGHISRVRHSLVSLLLVTLLLADAVLPGTVITSILLVCVLVMAWLGSRHGRLTHMIFAFLSAPLVAVLLVAILAYDDPLTAFEGKFGPVWAVLIMAALAYCGVMILKSLLTAKDASANEIIGAMNLYLIIGWIWAFVYVLLDHLDPASFSIDAAHGLSTSGHQYVYFSFVTMTTLGYGDIVPRTELAQTSAMLQAVFGQLYVAVIVGYLVSLFISHKMVVQHEQLGPAESGQSTGRESDVRDKAPE